MASEIPRIPQDHALIGKSKDIPINPPTPFISVSPITLPSPNRPVDLQMRVSAPITGTKLPVILLSHGHGQSNNLSSLNGYGPLANFWASHGFVVIQPTHLSSKSLSLSLPEAPLFWKSRSQDMSFIIDHLVDIESMVPTLPGRVDRTRIVVVGHSLGGHTAGMLLGATLKDPENSEIVSFLEPRIKAGILLAAPGAGNGGADLSEFARSNAAFGILRDPDFETMNTPTLVVVGEKDVSPHITVRGADWHADPYTLSGGGKSLLEIKGGEHGLGGVAGWDAKETTDESVAMVAVVQRMTWAYLRSVLFEGDESWEKAKTALEGLSELGTVVSK